MVPTVYAGEALVVDEPIPEVEAELDAADHEAHAAFLAAVREMVHGSADVVPASDRADDPTDPGPDRRGGRDADAAAVPGEPGSAVAEEDLTDWLPGLWVDDPPEAPRSERKGSRRSGRRSRRGERRAAAESREVARAVVRGISTDEPRADDEPLGDYLARVEAPRLPRRTRRSRPRTPRWFRRSLTAAVVVALLGACVAVPWLAPGVPAFLADLVPGGTTTAPVEDPPVAPSTDAFVGPVGVSQQAGPYDGVRLGAAGPPREVVVDRLKVDSAVIPISGQSGTLLPPSDPQLLGWWREGKPAGAQYGSTVVTGHTVHTGGGALDHLDKLEVGDHVRVRTDNGWITYVVQRSQIYAKAELARDAQSIFRQGGSGRLVLITCDDWNGQFYESNAVVFATPVDDEPFVTHGETQIPDGGPAAGASTPSGNMDGPSGVVTAKMFDR